MIPEKGNVSLTLMEQPLKGDTKKKFPRSSNLNSLSPFFDEENKVIRVGGRLANSHYTIDRKFPVLIPRKSPITEMLIREAPKKIFTEDLNWRYTRFDELFGYLEGFLQ